MQIAVYGGSFNPPHMGHAMVAAWLVWSGRVDQVWLLPTFVHAFAKDLAPFDHRLALCAALAERLGPEVMVCPIEGELPAPSYTIDTLRALADRHPEHSFRLVLGTDNRASLSKWKAWDAIERDFRPLFVGRAGYDEDPSARALTFPRVSSTEIRDRLAAGRPIDHLVPAGVRRAMRGWPGWGGSP